ncbi:hypothetical protein DFH06DRAFT_618376 [Mycena polygramma]|nr:hypothetical protein DFH06DRAFT_618376 [Mycena polygramma]
MLFTLLIPHRPRFKRLDVLAFGRCVHSRYIYQRPSIALLPPSRLLMGMPFTLLILGRPGFKRPTAPVVDALLASASACSRSFTQDGFTSDPQLRSFHHHGCLWGCHSRSSYPTALASSVLRRTPSGVALLILATTRGGFTSDPQFRAFPHRGCSRGRHLESWCSAPPAARHCCAHRRYITSSRLNPARTLKTDLRALSACFLPPWLPMGTYFALLIPCCPRSLMAPLGGSLCALSVSVFTLSESHTQFGCAGLAFYYCGCLRGRPSRSSVGIESTVVALLAAHC